MVICKGCSVIINHPTKKWCSKECNRKNYKPPMETAICQECEKEYTRRKKDEQQKFCSKKCVGAVNGRRVTATQTCQVPLTCKHCNKSYSRSPYAAKTSKFCSRECQKNSSAPVTLVCTHCEQKYKCIPASASRSKYCSKKCQNTFQSLNQGKGKDNHMYKHGLFIYRQNAIDTYGEQCRICKSISRIEVHHIDANRENNEIDNLAPLCHKCHSDVHKHAKRGAKVLEFFDECPKDDVYHAYILPIIQVIDRKKKAKKSKS